MLAGNRSTRLHCNREQLLASPLNFKALYIIKNRYCNLYLILQATQLKSPRNEDEPKDYINQTHLQERVQQ